MNRDQIGDHDAVTLGRSSRTDQRTSRDDATEDPQDPIRRNSEHIQDKHGTKPISEGPNNHQRI